jgi:hypothetical protein
MKKPKQLTKAIGCDQVKIIKGWKMEKEEQENGRRKIVRKGRISKYRPKPNHTKKNRV